MDSRATRIAAAGALSAGLVSASIPADATTGQPVSAAASSTRYVVTDISSLTVRSGPGTSYAKVGSVMPGTVVTGTSSGSWFRITAGDWVGRYVHADYLRTATPISATVIYTYGTVNARSAPRWGASVRGTYGAGAKITGHAAGDWVSTSRGYVYRAALVTGVNGQLPAASLCALPTSWNSPGSFGGTASYQGQQYKVSYTSGTVRYANCHAARALSRLQEAYRAATGRYARIDLAYRSLDEQKYWAGVFGIGRAAAPGTSNHGYGLAIDFRETGAAGEEFGWGGSGWKWLAANAPKYGFSNPFRYGTAGESYHWEIRG